jgi:hypothetical protein
VSRTMFLVQRTAFDLYGWACSCQIVGDTGSRVPLRLFASRESAEAYCAERTAQAHRDLNPFVVSGHGWNYSFSEEDRAGLVAKGLPSSGPTDDWKHWWDEVQDTLTDEQRAIVWELFLDRPIYAVVAVEIEE